MARRGKTCTHPGGATKLHTPTRNDLFPLQPTRTYCALLSSTPAGNLLTLGESSRSCEGESIKATNTESVELGVSSVTRPQRYDVEGTVNVVPALFLVDTGTAVTLLRRDT